MTTIAPEEAKTLDNLIKELHEKQSTYVDNIEAHIAFRRHPKYQRRMQKNKIMLQTFEADEALLNSLRFGAQDLLTGFAACLDCFEPKDMTAQLAKAMSGTGLSIFLHCFSLATSRYEEMNAANSLAAVHKFNTQTLPELHQKLLKLTQESKEEGGKAPLLSASGRGFSQRLLGHARKNSMGSSSDLNAHDSPELDLTQHQLELVARDQFSPFISTIQRAVQIRSFLERIILETLIPKSYKAFKDDCMELKKYAELSSAGKANEKNPADAMARQVIAVAESYRAESKAAEARIASASDVAKNQAEATKLNILGENLLSSQDFQKAIDSFRKAIKLDPTQYVFQENMGSALAGMHLFQEASQAFNDAIRLRKVNDKSLDSYQQMVKSISGETKDNLQAQIKKLTVKYIEDSKIKARQFEQTSREMDERMSKLKTEYESKMAKLASMEAELTERLAALARQEAAVTKLREQFQQGQAGAGQAALEKEQAQLEKLKSGLDQQSNMLEQEKQRAAQAQEQLQKAERENKLMQAELQAAKKAMAQYQQEEQHKEHRRRVSMMSDEDAEDLLIAMDLGHVPCNRPLCVEMQKELAKLPSIPAEEPPKQPRAKSPDPPVKASSPPPARRYSEAPPASKGPKRAFLADPEAISHSYVTPTSQ